MLNESQLCKKKICNSCLHFSENQSINAKNDQWKSSYKLNDVSENIKSDSNEMPRNAIPKYKRFRNLLRKSFQKSKKIIESEKKRVSNVLYYPTYKGLDCPISSQETYMELKSNSNSDNLFFFNESASVSEQIAQTVSICRKLPNLENSKELVEAERLLLFSTLHKENQQASKILLNDSMNKQIKIRFFIAKMYLPIQADVNRDIFFNYFYIVTFEYAGIIKSTLSAECENGTAIFRNCGIELELCSELKADTSEMYQCIQRSGVRCNIFMLRLRKVSTLGAEPQKEVIYNT